MKRASVVIGLMLVVSGVWAADDGAWKSSVAAGLNVTSGNSETLAANGSVTAEKAGDVHEIRMGVEVNYGEAEIDGDDQKNTDNSKAVLAYKYKLNGTYFYSDNSVLRDDIAEIDYRLVVGVGLGHYVIETEAAKLGLELGVAYIEEERGDTPKDDSIALRIAARHDQSLSEHAKFWLSSEYLPNVDDVKDYLLNSEVGIEAALNTSLSLRVVAQDRYDNVVPVGQERNDLSLISSLVYSL